VYHGTKSLKNSRKNYKKISLAGIPGTKSPLLEPKIFWLQLQPSEKKT
jgi:hypothetical protein